MFRVQRLGSGVWGLGFVGCREQEARCRVQSVDFRVLGLGLRV